MTAVHESRARVTVERLVPVRSDRYDALLAVACAAIGEHAGWISRGGHGQPAVDCPLCAALVDLIAPGTEVGTDERAYLDSLIPPCICIHLREQHEDGRGQCSSPLPGNHLCGCARYEAAS